MGHYAKVEDGIVTEVIVSSKEHADTLSGTWIKTSYNTLGGKTKSIVSEPLRKNFAGIGMIYDKDRDAFYEQKPFDSWTLNEDTCMWEPPVKYPDDGGNYRWNESKKAWDVVE